MTDPAPASPGPPQSLARKLGRIFLLLTLVTVALSVLVVVNLRYVLLDSRKFSEELREASLANSLLSAVEPLREAPARGASAERRSRRVELARGLLDELWAGPEGEDPSSLEHQSAEDAIFAELAASFERFRAASGERGAQAFRRAALELDRIEELTAAIQEETEDEALAAQRDLESRVRVLVAVMVATAIGAMGVPVALFAYVHRQVVRPLGVLQRGARRFGDGELDHRIGLTARDEIGELAREFDRMADRLDRSHRELERRVRERTRELIRAARLADLGSFAAGIAHEVNTPLASIASSAEGLERRIRSGRTGPEEQVEYLRTIAREAYRARDITARMLAFAREDPGERGPVDLGERLREVTRLLDHQLAAARVELDLDLAAGLPPASANAAEVAQVLLNLLRNALDAVGEGGWIGVRSRRGEAGTVVVEVEDDGPGLAPEVAGSIFEPFFTTKEPGRGTGLGLSLAVRIVEGFGGRITFGESSRGGAAFRVELPAAKAVEGGE